MTSGRQRSDSSPSAGRPFRSLAEHAYVLDRDGKPIPDAEALAEAEITHFAMPERSLFREPDDICQTCNQHALRASTVRVLQDAPLGNLVTRQDNEALFHQAVEDN